MLEPTRQRDGEAVEVGVEGVQKTDSVLQPPRRHRGIPAGSVSDGVDFAACIQPSLAKRQMLSKVGGKKRSTQS